MKDRLQKGWVVTALLLFMALPGIKAQSYSVQTNGLKLLTTTFNVEGSMMITPKWSAHLGVDYNPWNFKQDFKTKHITVEPGARYWMNQTYIGGYIGASLTASRYNFTLGEYRYDGLGAGAAAKYGFSWLIDTRWNVEAEAGIGAMWGSYTKYDKCNCGPSYGKGNKVFLQPKLGLNIVYLF